MSIGMIRIHHVKIPVTDLGRSMVWYARLLDLVLCREFVEQDALRGAALRSPEASFLIALRERQFCASRPDLAGFDVVALHIISRDALAGLAVKCDRLGIEHSPIRDRGPDEAIVDVPDPDGTVLRFLWERESEQRLRFIGLSFGGDGPPAVYDTPRLPEIACGTRDPDRHGRIVMPASLSQLCSCPVPGTAAPETGTGVRRVPRPACPPEQPPTTASTRAVAI